MVDLQTRAILETCLGFGLSKEASQSLFRKLAIDAQLATASGVAAETQALDKSVRPANIIKPKIRLKPSIKGPTGL